MLKLWFKLCLLTVVFAIVMSQDDYNEEVDYALNHSVMEAQQLLKHAENDVDMVLEDLEAIIIKQNETSETESKDNVNKVESLNGTEVEVLNKNLKKTESTTQGSLQIESQTEKPMSTKPMSSTEKTSSLQTEKSAFIKYFFGKQKYLKFVTIRLAERSKALNLSFNIRRFESCI
jgi:hypothetical protein